MNPFPDNVGRKKSSFHPVVSQIEGIEYLGRVPSFDSINGIAKYKLRDVEITHFQEFEIGYDTIEVVLKGDNETALGEVEQIIKASVLPK